MIDELTGLFNAKFLDEKYKEYISKYHNANYIMFDFCNFKKINDTYGHEFGDICLKIFANKLKNFFRDSLVVRLHGDEFVVVTFKDEDSINKILNLIDSSIESEVKAGIIPLKFNFNAGSTPVDEDMSLTQNKADCMMYFAKKRKMLYKQYDDDIFQKKVNEKSFLENFKSMLNGHMFSYYGRSLYDKDEKETNNIQLYTRNVNGENILDYRSYNLLRNNFQISSFDIYNLQNIIEKTSMLENDDNNYIIEFDYKSLLTVKELLTFLEYIKVGTYNGLENVILSIDLFKVETNEYALIIEMINILSELGFKIKLDKINNRIADYIVEEINPKFLKIEYNYWKQMLESERKRRLFQSKLDTYTKMGDDVSIIFDRVETEEESKRLRDVAPQRSLYLGNYYSKERKISF